MNISPTGRVVRTADGLDLVVNRLVRGRIEDVWASITETDRTARWFGRWEGDAAPGRTIRVQMGFEDQAPWSDARIESCNPPTHLGLVMMDGSTGWQLEVVLAERGDQTELTFTQHRVPADQAGDIGPGWEYYLDNLIASRDGDPLPDFDDYYPAQRDYYQRQVPAGE